MGVAPWDLLDRPIYWRERALMAERIEGEAQKDADKRAERSRRTKGH